MLAAVAFSAGLIRVSLADRERGTRNGKRKKRANQLLSVPDLIELVGSDSIAWVWQNGEEQHVWKK